MPGTVLYFLMLIPGIWFRGTFPGAQRPCGAMCTLEDVCELRDNSSPLWRPQTTGLHWQVCLRWWSQLPASLPSKLQPPTARITSPRPGDLTAFQLKEWTGSCMIRILQTKKMNWRGTSRQENFISFWSPSPGKQVPPWHLNPSCLLDNSGLWNCKLGRTSEPSRPSQVLVGQTADHHLCLIQQVLLTP